MSVSGADRPCGKFDFVPITTIVTVKGLGFLVAVAFFVGEGLATWVSLPNGYSMLMRFDQRFTHETR